MLPLLRLRFSPRHRRRLFVAFLSLVVAVSVGYRTASVGATEASSLGYTSWREASFPVEDFIDYTSPFGYRGSEFHSGLDLAAPEGSYIRSWWGGKVVAVIDDSRCGTGLVIESGNWEHVYCHMNGYVQSHNGQRYLIDRNGGIQIYEGQDLPTASRIGRVGMTGRTTGPHLHWGLKYDGDWVDPALVLRQMYAEQSS
ncbi:MAG: M23 family metallopeptidase [Geitlerinemataceae cyanobacterium]